MLIIATHLEDLLYFLYSKSAAVSVLLKFSPLWFTDPFPPLSLKRRMKKCFFYSDSAVSLHAHPFIICLLIIWTTTVKVLNEAQTKTLELKNPWCHMVPISPASFCNQFLIWYYGWKSWSNFSFWPYFCLSRLHPFVISRSFELYFLYFDSTNILIHVLGCMNASGF